jgi:hypothetical protein
MIKRYEYVREDDPMTVADTYRVDLPKFGNLSSILLRFSANDVSGLAQTGGLWRILDFITKITVLGDGSEIIKSLSAADADAVAFWDQLVMPPDRWRNYASNTQFAYVLLNFGRYKGDKQFGLDLGQFKNVELQITNTMSAATFTTPAVSILGLYIDEAAPRQFLGHLRTEAWRVWTTVADETKYLDLDVDLSIRRIILRALPVVDGNFLTTTGLSNLMDRIELLLDTGRVKLLDQGIDDLMVCNYYMYNSVPFAGGFPYVNSGGGVDMSIGVIDTAVAGGGSQAGTVTTVDPTIESARTDRTQRMLSFLADHPIGLIVKGTGPFSSAVYPFSYDDDPAEYLDPNLRKQVKLNIHTRNAASAAGGINEVILDRLVKY